MVEPIGQCAGGVQGEALVEEMEGHVLKSVVVQRRLKDGNKKSIIILSERLSVRL